MWHLILPPIIIVVSAGLLAWYLSRKIAEPTVSAKLEAMLGGAESDAKARALSRKEFILKLSERIASFFKVSSLRIHNFFQHSTESIREQRKKIQEMKRVADNISSSARARAASISKPSFSLRWKSKQGIMEKDRKEMTEGAVTEKAAPAVSQAETTEEQKPKRLPTFGFFRREKISMTNEGRETVEQETISETVALVELPKPKREEKWREDEYIRRISENPKDIRAYEELGDYYISVENIQDAKACYKQVLKLDPKNRAVKGKILRLGKFFEKRDA